jgi:hypothetical protein
MLTFLLSVVAAVVISGFGFTAARNFVRTKLRYVDAVNHPLMPLAAGVGAGLLGSLAVTILPIVGAGTALAFGASVGLGVASGAREIRRALPPGMN